MRAGACELRVQVLHAGTRSEGRVGRLYVDGVEVRGRTAGDGVAVASYKCHYGDNQKFTFTPTGHIQEVKSGKCLQVAAASAGIAVSLDTCDETKKGQSFKLAQ